MDQYQNSNGFNTYSRPVVQDQMAGKKRENLAVGSLIFGVMSIVFCWVIALPAILGVTGIIIGLMGLVKHNVKTGIGLAGVITSAVGLVLSTAVFILVVSLA